MPSTEAGKKILEALPPCGLVWPIFIDLVETPRGSFYHEKIVPMLLDLCKNNGLEAVVDEINNVLVTVPATPGYEDKPGICLQAHSDIVNQKDTETEIDFKTDPLVPRIVKQDGADWMMATGTSLGADDGIGIAMAIALALDKDIPHGPLEILITSDEEVGLLGAAGFKPGTLKSKYIINIDSEDYGVITISCAGGFCSTWKVPYAPEPVKDMALVNLNIKGFSGGHTGVEITKPLGNALHILARLVVKAFEKEELRGKVRLVKANGGSAHNAIARDVAASFAVDPAVADLFKTTVEEEWKSVVLAYKASDPGLDMACARAGDAAAAMTCADTMKFFDFLLCTPHGPHRMSPAVPGLVETSFATSVLTTTETEITILGAARSSVDTELDAYYSYLSALARGFGYSITPMNGRYAGWPADPSSRLLKISEEVFREITKTDAKVEAIHAGLEAGMIVKGHPGMEAISIGPTIVNPHSPKEAMRIDTVVPTYELLVETVKKLSE